MADEEVCPVSVEDALYKFEHRLTLIDGVASVHIRQVAVREIRIQVALSPFDWDVRDAIVEQVDAFARDHITEVSMVLEVVDAADLPVSLSA
jgi:hypothetical protein